MIQRIQSVYLFISIILVSIVLSGMKILEFTAKDNRIHVSSFGLYKIDNSNQELEMGFFPFYILMVIVLILLTIALFSYKKLSRQRSIARFAFITYILLLIILVSVAFLQRESGISYKLNIGTGLYLLVIGFVFSFLALRGIKKDKALVDSLNRLR